MLRGICVNMSHFKPKFGDFYSSGYSAIHVSHEGKLKL